MLYAWGVSPFLRRGSSGGGVPAAVGPTRLFVVAGQSQMIRTGVLADVDRAPEDANIVLTALNAALDPGATPDTASVHPGCWLPFARYLARMGVAVGVVGGAQSAAWIGRWQQGEDLYEATVAAALATGLPVAALLFAQGESDANASQPTAQPADWAALFAQMVAGMRADLGSFPVLMGRLAHTTQTGAYTAWDQVKAQQDLAAAAVSDLTVVDPEPVQLLDDGVHWTDASYAVTGARYAAAWLGH